MKTPAAFLLALLGLAGWTAATPTATITAAGKEEAQMIRSLDFLENMDLLEQLDLLDNLDWVQALPEADPETREGGEDDGE